MKKWILGCLTVTLCLLFPIGVLAEEVGAYESNGVTTFYGTYENPEEDEDGSTGTDSGTGSDKDAGSQTGTGNGSKVGSQQSNASGKKILPVTGSTDFTLAQLMGTICLSTGTIIIFWKKKHEKNM